MVSAVVKSGTAVVVLIQGTSPESQVTRFVEAFGPGVQHMALSVSDMNAALARLPDGGAEPAIELIEEEGLRQVFLRRDPESGVRIETYRAQRWDILR
jgi:4-hydroxyphenylpyruvate dioxygenase-like putative hemolysin